ncbi:MAG TPA: RDD family protein [Acidimicrobiia bacterium]
MEYEDRISIPTPEGVEIEMVLAGLGSRLAAAMLDWIIINGILLSLWIVGLVIAIPADLAGGVLTAGLISITFLVLFGYDTAFETLNSGRTPGKRLLGIRVVRYGGEPPGFLAAAVRNLLRLVDVGILPVGVLCILFTARHQRVGDLAAGTLVVRELRPGVAAPASWVAGGWTGAERYAGWDVSGVTPAEVATVRRFLERRHTLDPAARHRLGEELAVRLRPRVAGVPPGAGAEEFLEGLSAAKAARA